MSERINADQSEVFTPERIQRTQELQTEVNRLAKEYGKEGCLYVTVTGMDTRKPGEVPGMEYRNFSCAIGIAATKPQYGPEAMCKMLAALQLVQLQVAASVVEDSNMTSEKVAEEVQKQLDKMVRSAEENPDCMKDQEEGDAPFIIKMDDGGEEDGE